MPVYFDSVEALLAHQIMRPELIFMKEEGIPETRKVLRILRDNFPDTVRAVGYFPNPKRIRYIESSDLVYSFPLNEPEDATMNHIKTKLVMRRVDFTANEHPALGEAGELFSRYLLLKPNIAICFSHVAAKKTAIEIGELMYVSPRTVEGYVSKLKAVFGCSSKKELEKIYSRISHLSSAITQEQYGT